MEDKISKGDNCKISKNGPIQIYRKLHVQTENFQVKKTDIFHISAQDIDCGYSLELPM